MTGDQQYFMNTSLGQACINDFTTSATWNKAYGGTQVNAVDFTYLQPIAQQQSTTKQKEKKMAIPKGKRGLFQVILVDPKKRAILFNDIVISDSIEDVLLEVDAGKIIKDKGLIVSEVDKIINVLGQIRKTKKSKEGEIEIVNEEEKAE